MYRSPVMEKGLDMYRFRSPVDLDLELAESKRRCRVALWIRGGLVVMTGHTRRQRRALSKRFMATAKNGTALEAKSCPACRRAEPLRDEGEGPPIATYRET